MRDFYHTDTSLYLLSLALALSIHNKLLVILIVFTLVFYRFAGSGHYVSMTRTLPADTLLWKKSQYFSIVWADNTDSICDLPSMLTFLDNFKSKRYRTNATSSSPATGRSARRASNGAAAPSSLPSPSSLP